MRYYDAFPPYVPVAQRRAKAEKQLRRMQKDNPNLKPVILHGTTLARTWWGKSWNSNLERYADYSNRIGRGRTYVRNRAVLDLQVSSGTIKALVQGSRPQPYKITISIGALSADHWSSIRQACEGRLDSLSELLAGTFPQALKDLFFAPSAGLFPAPRDIHFDCSCPDWASMCKHIAAALYGVGARLDEEPTLFFTLRGINMDDLITQTLTDTAQTLLGKAESQSQNILHDVDLGEVFGIQLDESAVSIPDLPAAQPVTSTPQKPTSKARKTAAVRQTPPPAIPSRVTPRPTVPVARNIPPTSTPTARAVPTPPPPRPGSMLQAVVKAAGIARKGKTVEQLQAKLGWTRMQVRNALRRAETKGLIEAVTTNAYRRKR